MHRTFKTLPVTHGPFSQRQRALGRNFGEEDLHEEFE